MKHYACVIMNNHSSFLFLMRYALFKMSFMMDFIEKIIVAPQGICTIVAFIAKILATPRDDIHYVGLHNKDHCSPSRKYTL